MIVGNDQTLINELKTILSNNFKIKDLGEMKSFLRLEIARSKHGITLNQRKYALELISEMGYFGIKPIHAALEQNTKFTTKGI